MTTPVCQDRPHPLSWEEHQTPPHTGERQMSVTSLAPYAVHLRPEDNVAVAARHLPAGHAFRHDGNLITLDQRIGLGHKIALRPIRKGEPIYKYGQVIGFASRDVAPGELVHVHNV